MLHLPLALSISHYLNSAGTDAGFAAIVGLAIVILLYFAHARETANLREHAEDLADRVEDLEARLAEVARVQARAAQAAVPAPPASARPGFPGAQPAAPYGEPRVSDARPLRLLPFAPAGSAAPALAAATRIIPLPRPRPVLAPVAAGEGADPFAGESAGGAYAAPAAAAQATMAVPPPAEAPGFAPPASARPASAPPATVAAGGNGAPRAPVRPSSGGRAASPPPPPRTATRAAAVAGASRAVSDRGMTARNAPGRRGRSRRRGHGLLWGLGGLLGGVLVIVLAVVLLGGGSSRPGSTSGGNTASRTARRTRRAALPFSPAAVTVAVLNGTGVNGLAHDIALRLSSAGYREGAVKTAADQTHTATIVAYFGDNRSDALHVARQLGLGSASVQPVDPATQAVACPPGTPCTAQVAVTVGADLASSSTTGSSASSGSPTSTG